MCVCVCFQVPDSADDAHAGGGGASSLSSRLPGAHPQGRVPKSAAPAYSLVPTRPPVGAAEFAFADEALAAARARGIQGDDVHVESARVYNLRFIDAFKGSVADGPAAPVSSLLMKNHFQQVSRGVRAEHQSMAYDQASTLGRRPPPPPPPPRAAAATPALALPSPAPAVPQGAAWALASAPAPLLAEGSGGGALAAANTRLLDEKEKTRTRQANQAKAAALKAANVPLALDAIGTLTGAEMRAYLVEMRRVHSDAVPTIGASGSERRAALVKWFTDYPAIFLAPPAPVL